MIFEDNEHWLCRNVGRIARATELLALIALEQHEENLGHDRAHLSDIAKLIEKDADDDVREATNR